MKNYIFCLFLLITSILSANESPVSAHLSANHTSITPGQEFELLLDIKLEEGWHAYWKNPGDVGAPPSIRWDLPEGLTLIHTDWPTPERFDHEQMVTYGYTQEAPFLITLKASNHLASGKLKISGEIQWVVCSSDTCLPGNTPVETEIQVGETPNPVKDERFTQVKEALPKGLPSHFINHQLGAIKVTFPEEIAMGDTPQFFPEDQDYKKSPLINGQEIEIPLQEDNKPLKGVIVLGKKGYSLDLPAAAPKQEESLTLMWALLFALAGGLILNLMPCVLPVVSLKVMSFIKMAGNCRKELMKQGLAFTFGVLLSFWALAALLIGLQATGQAVGWGFQLQDPLFTGGLALLFTFLALNLFGVFEIGTSLASAAGGAAQSQSSFWSGVFATAVATPCTGPFMGSALGYASTQPAYISLAVFTALGLGMSLPYLAIGFFPSLIRWLPKPGAWMESFKQFLGFIMLLAVIWLLWVFIGQTSELGLFLLLIALLTASLAGWVYGRFGNITREKSTRKISYWVTAILLLGSFIFIKNGSTQVESTEVAAHHGWEAFSPEKVAELRKDKKPILIDFTAKWCLICQANHLAMTQDRVMKKFQEKGVVLMKADWTRYDPVITEALKKYGRSGVPLYVLYGEDEHPTILPQVLTPEIVMNAIEQTKNPKTYVR